MLYPYLHVASHNDLKGGDRILYRFFEMVPGLISWATLIGAFVFSWIFPVGVAVFIILFDLYWIIKTFYLSMHLRANWHRLKYNLSVDWHKRLENLKWEHLWQIILLPVYKEPYEIVAESIESLIRAEWPKDRMIVVLATEERAGNAAEELAEKIKKRYASSFGVLLITRHPANLPDEIPGKGSNISWAAARLKEEIIDPKGIPYENIIVSSFDVDTQVYPQYFLCLAYNFLTTDKPHRASYQPVPLYNNNIWEAHALARVIAISGTYWQMMQQERPERLTTFSSHAMSFKMLTEVGFWQKNMVSEDSRIFWNAFFEYGGDYRVIPLAYPISMDANVGRNFLETVKNNYKQQRRWNWGTAENATYIFFNLLKHKGIAMHQKIYIAFIQLEAVWSLATNPILIAVLGWLPLLIGGDAFNTTILSYNLPRITRLLMTVAMLGLVTSPIISAALIPPRPKGISRLKWIPMSLQWLLIPITLLFFGALPGLDGQTRLMFSKPLGFWVTPKRRNHVA